MTCPKVFHFKRKFKTNIFVGGFEDDVDVPHLRTKVVSKFKYARIASTGVSEVYNVFNIIKIIILIIM